MKMIFRGMLLMLMVVCLLSTLSTTFAQELSGDPTDVLQEEQILGEEEPVEESAEEEKSAETENEVSYEPIVRVTLSGKQPKHADTFTFTLTAEDEENPMPEGLMGGKAELKITGAGKGSFGEIIFDSCGIYRYTVSQVRGSNQDCTYDKSVYEIEIYVTNDGKGGKDITIVLFKKGKENKPTELSFHNVYPAEDYDPADKPKTGVEDNWPYYLIGCVVLLVLSAFMVRILFRKKK